MANNIFTGGTTDWGTASNWSLGVVPTATDGHITILDGSSPNLTLAGSNKVCNHFVSSAFTGTLTFGVRSLTVSGDITFGTGHTFSVTTGGLLINTTGSITTNGFVIPTNFQFGGSNQTYTLQDDFYISPLALSFNAPTVNLTINNNGTPKTIYAGGSVSTSAAGVGGTARLVLNGSGTINSTGSYRLDMDINTSGTYTIGTAFRYSTGTLSYISGTVNPATSTFFLAQNGGTGTTLNVSGITWYNVATQVSATVNLGEDLYVGNQLTNTASLTYNGGTIHVLGILSLGGSLSVVGTSELRFDGANPTWISGTGNLRLNTFIQPTNTFTLGAAGASNCNYQIGTLKYISGTTIVADSTLDTGTSGAILDLDGMVLNNFVARQGTITLDSKLTVSGTSTLGQASSVTFDGAAGWEFGNLVCSVGNKNIQLQAGNTYDITTSMSLIGTSTLSSGNIRLLSNISSSDAYLNLASGATCHNRFCNATDINSAGGRQITTVKGTLLRTTNWYVTNPDGFFDFY